MRSWCMTCRAFRSNELGVCQCGVNYVPENALTSAPSAPLSTLIDLNIPARTDFLPYLSSNSSLNPNFKS